ncbi:MAG: PspC domain-containing protein [Dehalococcoidia bacterium]
MQQQPPTPARLSRDTTNHMIGGVCAGIARQYGYDVTVVRIVAILLTLVWGAGLLLYLALWVIMPADAPASNAPTSLPAPEPGTSTATGNAAADTAFAAGSSDDLAERARRAADDFAIAARSAAEAARVAADQLADVARAATAAGRESWEQQRAARSEAERTEAGDATASTSASGAPGVSDASPSPAAPSTPEYETTPPPGPDDAREDAPMAPPSP